MHSKHSIRTGSKKGTSERLCKIRNTHTHNKNMLKGQKKSEDEKVVGESNSPKVVAVLHDSSEQSYEDGSTCSDSGGSESDCKD